MRKATTQTTQLAITDEEFFEPLDAIHRNEDAKIGFARKTGEMQEKFENIFSLSRKKVRAMLPAMAQEKSTCDA